MNFKQNKNMYNYNNPNMNHRPRKNDVLLYFCNYFKYYNNCCNNTYNI